MSTKIDAYAGTPPTTAVRATARLQDATSAQAHPAGPADDTLALTGEARQLQQVEQQARAHSGVDESRVAETRLLLAQGLYVSDPQAIAAALLRQEAGR